MKTISVTEHNNLEDLSLTKPQALFKICCWFAVLLFIPQINIGLLMMGYYVVINDMTILMSEMSQWLTTTPTMLVQSFLSLLITFPFLYKATVSSQKANDLNECIKFWSISRIKFSKLVMWSMAFLAVFGCFYWLQQHFNVPVEAFMNSLKQEVHGVLLMFILFITAGVLAPVVEEIIYRGWLYQRLLDTEINEKVIVILTAFVFTIVHSQYDHLMTFSTLMAYGLLLGIIRFYTQNLSYTIVIHMIYNLLTVSYLMFW